MTADDWLAVRLTAALAASATVVLLLLGTPLAWWLARTRSRKKPLWQALLALPLVLPPTVLGFYLLLLLGPQGPLGAFMAAAGWQRLPFTFGGVLLASVLATLPFVVQPLQLAFAAVPESLLEAAATLRAGPWRRFFTVVLPLSHAGVVAAVVLGFAHVVGEFGVVLMIGGNIPGATRVLSVALYDHVEAGDFAAAHTLAAGLLGFALLVLLAMYALQRPRGGRARA